MAHTQSYTFQAVIVEEHVEFTLPDLCRASGASSEELLALVQEGLLDPTGDEPARWRFSGQALSRTRTALRLSRQLDIGLAAAAIVLDLLDEIESLKARVRRSAGQPHSDL